MEFTKKLPPVFKNFYFIVGVVFVLWMIFLDSNNSRLQFERTSKLRDLERDKAYYEEKIKEVQKDREELLSNKQLLEKYAREKYLMRRKSEDLYVIITEEEE